MSDDGRKSVKRNPQRGTMKECNAVRASWSDVKEVESKQREEILK